MRRALDEFVVLGTTTNIGFLRDLCDVPEVISGDTYTSMIDDLYPNGYQFTPRTEDLDVALMTAAVAEQQACIERPLHPLKAQSVLQAHSKRSTGGILDAA